MGNWNISDSAVTAPSSPQSIGEAMKEKLDKALSEKLRLTPVGDPK